MRYIFAVLAALVLALPAAGQGNDPLMFHARFGDAGHNISQPVDYLTWCGDCIGVDYTTGTPWVVNPTPCSWDSDDFFSYVSEGSVLASDATAGMSECVYAGADPGAHPYRYLGVFLQSASPDLLVTETWAWDGGSLSTTTSPSYDQSLHAWRYFDCIQAPFAQEPLVEVSGSNGGFAFPQAVSVTVTNTGRKALKTGGVISSNYSQGELQLKGCLSFRVP